MAQNISFYVRMADTVMRFCVMNIETRAYMREYILREEHPAHCFCEISISEQDIIDEWEYMLSRKGYSREFVNRLPEYYFEIFALHRKAAQALLERNILVLHSSCVSLDGNGYLFVAPSGKGKSTHAKLWCRYFRDRAFIVNDDKPFLCLTGNGVTAYGSPWDGKHHQSRNTSVPVTAVGMIEPAAADLTEPFPKPEAFAVLFPQTLHPKDPVKIEKLKKLLSDMISRMEFYRVCATMNSDAPEVSFRGMKRS